MNPGEEEKQLSLEQYEAYKIEQEENGNEVDEYEEWSAGHGKILIKIAHKWMVFDAGAEFINRVSFYNQKKLPKPEDPEKTDKSGDET